jgi:hypothetical protein
VCKSGFKLNVWELPYTGNREERWGASAEVDAATDDDADDDEDDDVDAASGKGARVAGMAGIASAAYPSPSIIPAVAVKDGGRGGGGGGGGGAATPP